MRGPALHDRFVLAVAALFLCAHIASPARHLEDIDSVNFALGLRHYDVAAHQPHPPGYPVFIVLARGSAALVDVVVQADPADPEALASRDARAMSLLAAVAGALALFFLYGILRTIASPGTPAVLAPAATALAACTPLFWLTASRPLSDMPGLAGALGCQYLLLRAARHDISLRRAILAALACGVAVGVRSQVTWLVVPLLVWTIARVWRRGTVHMAFAVAGAALAGVLTWAVPMVWLTGGLDAYRTALASQAGEDLDGVPMLLLTPGVRPLAQALADTFVWPWGTWLLAAAAIALAAAGVVGLRRQRGMATWLVLGFAPYLAFHLLVQETETTRYALPTVPAIVALVVLVSTRWARHVLQPVVVLIGITSLAVSVRAHHQYAAAGMTSSEVLARMTDAAEGLPERPHVAMHRRVWAETRRIRHMLTPVSAFDVLPSPRAREWQEALPAWERDAPVWWLVDPRRGDRGVVDPLSMRLREPVRWPMPVAALLGGMRPHAFDWYDVSRPAWVLRDGWSLTPELAGVTAAASQGLPAARASAIVRGHDGASTLVVGGRFVAPAESVQTLDVRIGESWDAATWRVEDAIGPGAFAVAWTIPAGVLPAHGYVPLMVGATGEADRTSPVFLEQFDVQPSGVPVLALGAGWYEPERNVATGRTWRWVSDTSSLRVRGAVGDVRLDIAGTYPRHYGTAPVLEILAGGRPIATHTLSRPFSIESVIRASDLPPDGRIEWRVSSSFVAGERTGSADARRLALEIASLQVRAVR